jgi:lysophospholipase L1-like esterase
MNLSIQSLSGLLFLILAVPSQAVTIWTVGDSLTSGFTAAGAYRTSLYSALTQTGESVNLVGSSTNDASAALTAAGQTRHDGHSGWFIADTASSSIDNGKGIYENVQSWHSSIPSPEVILLMIGTNDLNRNNSATTASNRFALLLSRLEGLNPAARIIVGSVPKASETNSYKDASVTNLNASINSYNSAISSVVSAHANGGKNVEFLDVNAAMTLADLGSDGLHFTQAGYDKLGGLWANAVLVPEPGIPMLLVVGALLVWKRRR